MTVKINSFRELLLPEQAANELLAQPAESVPGQSLIDTENSSADRLALLGGEMRKMQLWQRFGAQDVSTAQTANANFSVRGARIGDDDELLKETQRLIENYRRQINPSEIKGAQPAAPGKPPGHSMSKHGVKPEVQAEIMNKPDRIFSGINKNGRYVDIYYKDGSAVITEFGNKERVISAYGKVSTKGGTTPFNIEKIAADSKYVEIKLEKLGSTNVVFPNRERFNKNDFPPRPSNPNVPPTTNGGSNSGNQAAVNPNKQIPPLTEKPVVTPRAPIIEEPPVKPRAPVIEENLPKPNALGKLSGNLSRGVVILQLVQLGLTALNFSELKADGAKFGYYIDPFFDKYVITDPGKAAQNLPEGFELKFFTDPNDYYSMGNSIKFTVKDGKFTNPDGYELVFNQEKGYVEAVLMA